MAPGQRLSPECESDCAGADRGGGRLRDMARPLFGKRSTQGVNAAAIVRMEAVRLAEHRDVLQKEATEGKSRSGPTP